MAKKELPKAVAYILLGIALDRLFQPNPTVQLWLRKFWSIKVWGIGMDIITLIILLVAMFVWLIGHGVFNRRKNKITLEDKVNAIIDKLNITTEDIQKYKETNMSKSKPQPPLTKKRFLGLLTKASKPVSEWQHDSKVERTSESHLSDDYSDKHTSQDKTEGKED